MVNFILRKLSYSRLKYPGKKTLHCAVDIFPVSETQIVLYFLNNCCRVIDTLFKNFKRSPYSRRIGHNIPLGYIYPRVALPPQEDNLWTHFHGGASPLLLHSHCRYRPRRKKMSQKIYLQFFLQPSQCHMHAFGTRFLLSGRQNGTVQIESEKTRFWAKLMKLQCRITLFLFTPRKHQGYEFISKFDELFEKQHHLSKLLN